jgi:transcriptional regulator with XRE-family HTH domain
MQTSSPPFIDPSLSLPSQLQGLRLALGKGIGELAAGTGLSRLTVSAAEGRTDARLSTLAALFDALGYTLVPVPKPLVHEVASFINNGGVTVSLPAGRAAPMGVGQRVFESGAAQRHSHESPAEE